MNHQSQIQAQTQARGNIWRLILFVTLLCFYPIYYAASAVIFPFAPVLESGVKNADANQASAALPKAKDILPKFQTSEANNSLVCSRIRDPRMGRANEDLTIGTGEIKCGSTYYQGFVVSRAGSIFVEPLYEVSITLRPKIMMQQYVVDKGTYYILLGVYDPSKDEPSDCGVVYRLAIVSPAETKVDKREIHACLPIATMSVSPPMGKAKSTIVSLGFLDKSSLIKALAYNVEKGEWLD